MLRPALLLLSAAAAAVVGQDCNLIGQIDFTTNDYPVIVSGCPGSAFRFDCERVAGVDDTNTDIGKFEFQDLLSGQKLVGPFGDPGESFAFTSYTSEVSVNWTVTNTLPVGIQSLMDVTYTEIPLVYEVIGFDYSRNGSKVPDADVTASIETNNRKTMTFEGIDQSVHRFDVKVNLLYPSFGSVFISTGNGRMAALNTQRGQYPIGLAVQPLNDTTQIDFVMSSFLEELQANPDEDDDLISQLEIDDFYLGEEVEAETTTTTTTTTTVDPNAGVIPIYIIGVDEQAFVNDSFPAFMKDIESMAPDDSVCEFAFAGPYSCREACHLTDRDDRGCVKTVVNVLPSVYCAYSNSMLREDLNEDRLDSLAKTYGATHIEIDDCMNDVQGWKLAAILVPIVVIILLFVALYTAKTLTKRRWKQMRQRQYEQQRKTEEMVKQKNENQTYEYATGMGATSAGGGAYNSPFEIVEEDDEY